ncbi:MAG: hypothetical protein Q9165_002255 [Trypethelium subeluteriae]
MDQKIQDQFTRVENALNTLLDSITSYNPSPAAAIDLVGADDELSEGLSQLAAHQANYVYICQLRAESQRLDEQTKHTMSVLADLRKELLATPATVFPDSQYEVNCNDLLSYAKRISRFTVPPTYRPRAPWDTKVPAKKADSSQSPDQQMPDADSTSPMGGEAVKEGESLCSTTGEQEQLGIGVRDLNESTKDWLDPLAKLPFVPWPKDEVIRSGGLATVQYLVETGKDLTTDPRREEAEAEERRREGEEEDKKRHEELSQRKQSYATGANGHRVSRQEDAGNAFSLDLYDEDEG